MSRVAAQLKQPLAKPLATFKQRYRRIFVAYLALSLVLSLVAIFAMLYATWRSQIEQQAAQLQHESRQLHIAVGKQLKQFRQDFSDYIASYPQQSGLSLAAAPQALTSTGLPASLQRWPLATLQTLSLADVDTLLVNAEQTHRQPNHSDIDASEAHCHCRWVMMPVTAGQAAQLTLLWRYYDGQLKPQYLAFQLPVAALAQRIAAPSMDGRYLLVDVSAESVVAELSSASSATTPAIKRAALEQLTGLPSDSLRYRWTGQHWWGQQQSWSGLPELPWQGLLLLPEPPLEQALSALQHGHWPRLPLPQVIAAASVFLLWFLLAITVALLLARQQRTLTAASQRLHHLLDISQLNTHPLNTSTVRSSEAATAGLYSEELQKLGNYLLQSQAQQLQQQQALQAQQDFVGLLQRYGLYRSWQYQPQARRITLMMHDADGIAIPKTYAIEQFAVLLDKQQRHAVLTFHCQTDDRAALGDYIDFQLRATADSPARWLRAYATYQSQPEQQGSINGLHIDVTEYYQQQQQLKQLQQQQQQQAAVWQRGLPRLQELLVTPLSAWLEQLERVDDSVEQRCQRQQWSRQLNNLVTYLAWQMDAIEPQVAVVNLSELLQQLDHQLLPCAEQRRLTLHFEVPEAAYAWVDRRYLRLIMMNLLDNAIQHSPPGKVIQIKLRDQQQHLLLSVSDVGAGMPAGLDSQQAFVEFTEAANQRSESLTGAGLGLALSHQLAALVNADLRIDEQTQKGCRVLLQLPKMPERQLD